MMTLPAIADNAVLIALGSLTTAALGAVLYNPCGGRKRNT